MALASNGPAPMLALEEQWRGDNTVARIGERLTAGRDVTLHQMGARDAYENAAAHTEQPGDRP